MDKKILLIDNGGLEYASFASELGSSYKLLIAEGSDEAISLLKHECNSVSAIIIDLTSAGRDGAAGLCDIRKNALWNQIPVIAVSDITDEAALLKAYSNGANSCVGTPINGTLIKHILTETIKLCEISAMTNSLSRDKLTGLYNRESFFLEASNMIQQHRAGYYVLSCFDIDSFKVINDQHGPEMGDRVLCHVASCINEFVSNIDGICCRFMADKFAVLYPSKYMDTEALRNNHAETTSPECLERPIRIHIGRYLVNDLSLSVSAMFDRATLAADEIRGRYDVYILQYNDIMRDNLLHEQKIVTEMSDALNSGCFEAWLQPQYNHKTGAIIGAEALVRWRTDSGRLVQPGEFISAFERNGFIYELDKNIWRQVCELIRKWLSCGCKPLPVSVNISGHIYQPDFFSYLTGLLAEYDIPIELLRLEITESAFSDSANIVINAVNKLIEYGFTVEIDDFGSGYSSLNTLKDVPAAIIKLDMRFFENTEYTQRSGIIIESVVRMAKWLGMSVIAEGVEDREQADYLKSIGCNLIQGYIYAKPMPVAEYEKLLCSSVSDARLENLETVENLNNSFWNAKSLETLIFNTYVGGACIFEYHNGVCELIRRNAEYDRIFSGYFSYKGETANKSVFNYLDEAGRKIFFTNIENSINERRESTCEVQLNDDNGHSMYIRSTVRVIARTNNRYMFYCVVVNASEEKENATMLTELLNALPGGVVIYKVGERIDTLYSSEGVRMLTGISKEKYDLLRKGDIISAFVYADDIPALRKHVAERVSA